MSDIYDYNARSGPGSDHRLALVWYMTGQGLWFIGLGIQFVVFQAIAALVLELDAAQLGLAQSALLLPALLFMLPGGVAAERNDGRLLLIRLQLAAILPPFVLGLMVLTKQLDFTGLIIYALMMGTIAAFIMPTRDALISYIVSPREIQRAVTIATGLQFAGQAIGMMIVGLSEIINIGWIPMIQSISFILAAFVTHRLPYHLTPPPSHQAHYLARRTAQIMDGFRLAFAHKEIAPTLIMMLAMGFFYMGTFFVLFPLLVRDHYQGGTGDIAIINIMFWIGMMATPILLLRFGRVVHLGRLMVLAAIIGLISLMLLSIPGPFWWVLGLCFFWGCGGGIFMSASRTIIQSRAPDSHRGRLLSIYQFSFLSGAPIGALMFGALVDIIGNLHIAPLVPMIGMFITLSFIVFFSRLWDIKLDEHEIESP